MHGENSTKPNLHEGTKFHDGKKLHEDDFAPRVNFARITVLHESKKIQKIKNKTEI